MKKKFTSLILALSLTACLFSGCGSKDVDALEKETTPTPTQGVEQETTVTQAPATENNQEVLVTQVPEVEVPEKNEAPLERKTILQNYTYYRGWGETNDETSYSYYTDEDGNIVKLTSYSVHSSLNTNNPANVKVETKTSTSEVYYEYTYYEDGSVHTVTSYSGSIDKNGFRHVIEYSKEGLLLRDVKLSGADARVEEEIIYTYDDSGVLIQTVETIDEGQERDTFTHVYDALGRVIKSISKRVDYDEWTGQIDRERINERDYVYETEKTDTGVIEHKYRINGTDKKEISLRKLDYDADGNLVQEHYDDFEEGTSYDELWRYEYNTEGVMIKKMLCYISDGEFESPKEVYEYDNSGNLLKVTYLLSAKFHDDTLSAVDTYNYITVRNFKYIKPILPVQGR